jgi:L-2,4-diaminobutyrate decarboxylase
MTEELHKRLPEGMFSTCLLDDKTWLRSVAANPLADINEIISTINNEIN